MFKTTALDSAANRFVDEVGVTPGTRLEAADKNIWMDELVAPVEAAGLTLDATGVNRDQLLEAIRILGKTAKNFIINGIGEINQRITAFTLVKDEYSFDNPGHGPDRHEGMATGTLVTAGTFGVWPSGAAVGVTGKTFKFVGVTLTGAGALYHRYRMEAKDAVKFKNQTVSFSSKVYHDMGVNRSFTIFVRKANAADNFGAVTAISDSGPQSIATATPTDFKYESVAMGNCENGIEIEIEISAGAIINKNIEITELQFELNSIATDFEYRNVTQELALCQRYYSKSYDLDVLPGTATIVGKFRVEVSQCTNIDHNVGLPCDFPVPMRDSPTVAVYDTIGGGTPTVAMIAGSVVGTIDNIGRSRCSIVGTNGAANTQRLLQFHYTAESEL